MNRKMIAAVLASLTLPFAAMAADSAAAKDVKADTLKTEAKTQRAADKTAADVDNTAKKATKKHKKVSPRRGHQKKSAPKTF